MGCVPSVVCSNVNKTTVLIKSSHTNFHLNPSSNHHGLGYTRNRCTQSVSLCNYNDRFRGNQGNHGIHGNLTYCLVLLMVTMLTISTVATMVTWYPYIFSHPIHGYHGNHCNHDNPRNSSYCPLPFQVAPTSQFSSSAILLLPIVGNRKLRFSVSFQSHNLHTKFHPNPSSPSEVESY
jgi:hypothetical protein